MDITENELRTALPSMLFRKYFYPTLFGMLGVSLVTMTDGVFVGQGCGADGVAVVNLIWAPCMLFLGLGLMLGMGSSVVASVALAQDRVRSARRNISQSLYVGCIVTTVIVMIMLVCPSLTVKILGASDTLMQGAIDYMMFMLPGMIIHIWAIIGLFHLRADGNPRLAMWATILPGLVNILLDYIFIYPMDMGAKGAALGTSLSYICGTSIVVVYLTRFSIYLRLENPFKPDTWQRVGYNIWIHCKIGVSGLLGESIVALTMFMGNIMTMRYIGDDGVGAFGIICYYLPFVFMIGNAIAQSAQPIISYNYGLKDSKRVKMTESVAIRTAICCGLIVASAFLFLKTGLTALFLPVSSQAGELAVSAFPYYALCAPFYIFNIASIGYFQSIKRILPAIVFALLRGPVFLVPLFILFPSLMGINGIWLALPMSEIATSSCIVCYYIYNHNK